MKYPLILLAFLSLMQGCAPKNSSDMSRSHETNAVGSTWEARDRATNASNAAADNTARNARDRNDANLTAQDQSETASDRQLTQNLRRSLTSNTNYSVAAQNIKIITANGKVTLRGPVNTATEKTEIASLARNLAGASNVDDQLEVKSNP